LQKLEQSEALKDEKKEESKEKEEEPKFSPWEITKEEVVKKEGQQEK
jgi:hypothetical protein